MGDPVDIPGYGKLSIASADDAPLLVVFGGIDVGGVQSGVYMWKYMDGIKDKFHIFVADNQNVNGTEAYRAVMEMLKAKNLTPSRQVLYLFSGGYKPGMNLLSSADPNLFSSIYLVDIWMGVGKDQRGTVPNFYKALAKKNAAKITYVYTYSGATNDEARDYIAQQVGRAKATLVKGGKNESGIQTHMRTNTVAVGTLQ